MTLNLLQAKRPDALVSDTCDAKLSLRLQAVVECRLAPQGRVRRLHAMPDGHAGLTFGFDVEDAIGESLGTYILKLAPPGVKRRGNTDVYRQVPLLTALHDAGLPVPRVLWAAADEAELGTPYLVMERLPGRTFVCWEPHASFGRDPQVLHGLWLAAARLLAAVHRVDWRPVLAKWDTPRPLADELARWAPVLRHAQEPAWLETGRELELRLGQTRPADACIGLVHGDYQPGNILYHGHQVVGLIDWELAFIGTQGLDLGWLLMVSDAAGWEPQWAPHAPISRTELIDAYRDAGGSALANIDWFNALATYRMGAIACLNVKLHRTGKRRDALWERFAPSIDYLFARGLALLDAAERQRRSA